MNIILTLALSIIITLGGFTFIGWAGFKILELTNSKIKID